MNKNSKIKKEKFLLVIAELFNKNGYEKTSIRGIAKELNISKPGLYFYFENKQHMLYELAYDVLAKSNDYLKEALVHLKDPEEKLLLIIQRHIQFFVKHPAQIKVVIYEAHSLEGEYAKKFRILEEEYVDIIRSVLKEILIEKKSDRNLNITTFSLLGTLGWVIKWYKPEKKVSPESLINEIWEFFLKGLDTE